MPGSGKVVAGVGFGDGVVKAKSAVSYSGSGAGGL